jgi:two-component system, OmpR family, phosphate regulon sensor histidine kinase PhoR
VGTLTQSFNDMADQLRNTIASLEREHARLAAVLQYMADGVLITDDAGIVRQANPAALRLLGSSETATIGHSLAQAVRDHQIIALWQRAQEQGVEQSETVDTGRQRPFLRVIVTPLRQTQTAAFLVVLQDLTQIRRLETVRRDFISNISHELRTPLAALKALTETLRDGALEDPPAAQRFLERMDGEVDTMAQMVQELLELARIESGQVPLRLSPATVEEVILPPLERLRPQAARARLELEVSLTPSLPRVWADVERAQQVVSNLVHNALKFTPAGGHITLSAYTQGNEVIITVRDTGIGIPADALPRVFERFFKADRARSGGGTGLGLAIAKHIVQGHGGRIWVESHEGEGSLFSFSLPLNETLTNP